MISYFKNVQSPSILREMDIYEAMDMIKNPDSDIKEKINQAREICSSHNKDEYNRLKTSLPCFNFNFQFDGYKKTENIIAPTGFIYLDVDGDISLDINNPFIFASWKSVSGKGRSFLVLVNGLTVDNFKLNYKLIADELGINADLNAAKPTQYCFHSYDDELYCNDNSIMWDCKGDTKNYPKQSYPIYNKDSNEMGRKRSIRFNSISDCDFNGEPYIFFEDEKELISAVHVPPIIEEGGRNTILYSIAYQIKALNPEIDYSDLSRIVHYVNEKRCFPNLKINEVEIIINKVDKLENPEPMLNEERRIIFNPEFNLTWKEKAKIMNPLLGQKRSKKTVQHIKDCLDNWDILNYGKVTQKSLAEISGWNIKTIQKYYRLFDPEILEINKNLNPKRKVKRKV